jgi:hypothetical protein
MHLCGDRCDLDSVILNFVIIVICILSFGHHWFIGYACIIDLDTSLAAKILNIPVKFLQNSIFSLLALERAKP